MCARPAAPSGLALYAARFSDTRGIGFRYFGLGSFGCFWPSGPLLVMFKHIAFRKLSITLPFQTLAVVLVERFLNISQFAVVFAGACKSGKQPLLFFV
jgi:hypothetical protein